MLLVLGMGGVVYAQTVSPPVVAIRVEGNENVNTQLILSAVSTSLKEPYNPEKVQADVKAIYDLGDTFPKCGQKLKNTLMVWS